MFLSRLRIDIGSDPALSRPGRLWLGNLYRVHQRLCMAFPSSERRASDPDFLAPYEPDAFAGGHVHVERGAEAGFLFRVEPYAGGTASLLVQSARKPDWDYAFHNAGYLLAAPPETKAYEPRFSSGETLRFRLVVNPTRKIDTKSGPDGLRRNGRRVPVPDDRLLEWLGGRAGAQGFSFEPAEIAIQTGFVHVDKSRTGEGRRLRSARFDGTLVVTDAERFLETLAGGVGSGKAFGFGLLSVAPRNGTDPNLRP